MYNFCVLLTTSFTKFVLFFFPLQEPFNVNSSNERISYGKNSLDNSQKQNTAKGMLTS